MSTIDATKVAKKNAEYFRRKRGGFNVPKELPESEKSEYYKLGEQIAEKVMREVFEKIEQTDREEPTQSRLSEKFHRK